MSNLRHQLHSAFKSTAEAILPVRSHSAIKDGVLTPDEFVAAGDYLVSTCPTWSWQAGEPAKAKGYLPKGKQFLTTRGVPCIRRTAAVDEAAAAGDEFIAAGDAGDDDWVAPPAVQHTAADRGPAGADGSGGGGSEPEDISTPSPGGGAPPAAASAPPAAAAAAASAAGAAALGEVRAAAAGGGEDGDDDDIPDIDDLALEDDEEDDEAAVVVGPPLPDGEGEGGVLRTRTYDLMISYDKYYQVPRLWLVGYDESGAPLTTAQVFEDVTEEHARKTITADPFPHTSVTAASIHPCKHAHVMKKLADRMEAGNGQEDSSSAGGGGSVAAASGRRLSVDAYLVLFLKFIASIVPNIEYDYTLAASL